MKANNVKPATVNDLIKFASKDKRRPALMCVYHDDTEQVAVACDGHVLIVSEDAYLPECGGKVIDKDGKECDAKYPRYKPLVEPIKDMTKVDIDIELFGQIIEQIYKGWTALMKSPTFKSTAIPLDGIMLLLPNDQYIFPKIADLRRVLALRKKMRIHSVYIDAARPESRAMLFGGEGKNLMLSMPMLFRNEDKLNTRFIYNVESNTLERGLEGNKRIFGCSVAEDYFDEVMEQVNKELRGGGK